MALALGRALLSGLALRGLAGARPGARRGLAALNHPDRFDVMGEAGAVKVTGCVPALRPPGPAPGPDVGSAAHPPTADDDADAAAAAAGARRPAGTGRRACW